MAIKRQIIRFYTTQEFIRFTRIVRGADGELTFFRAAVTNTTTYLLIESRIPTNEVGLLLPGITYVDYIYVVEPEDPTLPPQDPEIPMEDPTLEATFGRVEVHYVDQNGDLLREPIVDTADTLISSVFDGVAEPVLPVFYDTTDHKLEVLYVNGQKYLLAERLTTGSEFGIVGAGTMVVTYVYIAEPADSSLPDMPDYPENPIPAILEAGFGKVVVHFIDQNGQELQPPIVDTGDTLIYEIFDGHRTDYITDYDVSEYRQELIQINGKWYRLVAVSGQETGTLSEGNHAVSYIYELVEDTKPMPIPTPDKTVPVEEVSPTTSPAPMSTAENPQTEEMLPKTGENSSRMLTAVGALLTGFVLLGLLKKREAEE